MLLLSLNPPIALLRIHSRKPSYYKASDAMAAFTHFNMMVESRLLPILNVSKQIGEENIENSNLS